MSLSPPPTRPAHPQTEARVVAHRQPASAPRTSVIIVNYNGGAHLTACLRSLLHADRSDAEVIVLDNASTDGSAGEVERAFPRVRVIRSDANLGFGLGSNAAAERAAGEYLAFLNPDTVVEPGWLDALVSALEDDPQAGLATPKILLLNAPDCINTAGNDVHVSGLTLCRGMGQAHTALSEPAEVNAVSGAAFVIRKDLFEALGSFDDAFFTYVEDTDLSLRARLAGYTCRYVPSAIVYHDYALRFGPQKTFYQERNRYLLLLKAFRWPTLLALLPALGLAEAVTWGFVLLREPGRLTNKLRAYAWIVKHWRDVMVRRRQVQALRRVRDRDLIAQHTHRLAYEQTGDGLSARLAHRVFDPLFRGAQRLALALIRW